MSSRGRNFRRRGGDDEDNEEDEKNEKSTANNGASIVKTQFKSAKAVTISKPKKPLTTVPKSLLSFADDEEEESPFATRAPSSTSRVPRPSSSSSSSQHHKLSSTKERKDRIVGGHASSLPSNVQPQAGTYTKEALLELQKNTRTLAPSRPARSDVKPKAETTANEPVIVLRGLVKPNVIADTDGETDRKEVDSDSEEKNNFKKAERDEATVRMGSMALGNDFGEKTDVSGSVIPDKATIEAIRAKREKLRLARAAAPDYIALDGGSNHGAAEGLSDEEPEFQGRIGFFGEKIDKGKKGVFEDFEQKITEKNGRVESGDDDDEEDKMWEEEQVRKGLGKRLDDASSIGVSTSSIGGSGSGVVQSVHQPKVWDSTAGLSSTYSSKQTSASGSSAPSIGGAVGGGPGFDAVSISQQAELAKKALNENLRRLKESHSRTVASLTRTDENLSASLLKVATLETSLSALGEKFIFMQKLREFVSVICEFLQHKAPYIEELEYQMQKLQEERATAISERRFADNDDEMKELEAAVEAAKSVFIRGGNTQMMIETAKAAAQAALTDAKELKELPVELDEFGRDVNKQKRMDLSRRSEARQLRRNKSDSRRLSSVGSGSSYQLMEGESSTDESESETTAYQSNRDQLLQTAEQIFSDAREEYSQLSLVKEKFEKFKKEHASSYRDAYMSLSVPTIFSPFVRLELLKWDPLHEDADFINMNWHSLLFSYGLPEDESEVSADDADVNLIPELVEKLAVPILHHQLEHCWDMLSTSETKYAVSATNLVFRYVSLSSSSLRKLVSLLRDRLIDAVANLMIPTWDTLVMKVVPNAARVVAYRFGVSVRLMRNICLWNKILAMPILENIALDELLTGKILPHLRSIQSNVHDAIGRSERIVTSLDGVWAGPSVTGDRSPKLQPFVDYLLKIGEKLEKRHAHGGSESESAIKLARRLKKMLVELNEYDHARAILRTFNMKEAL